MNNKFTTFILTILLIVLLFGGIVLGGAIYMDIVGEEAINETYTVGNIVTEEPEEEKSRNLEITKSNISSVQGNTSENLQSSQEVTNTNTDIAINKYFYNQLFGNQKIIYDKMLENKDNLKLGNYKIEFSDTFSDTLSTDDGAEQLGKDYQTAIEAFMHDNPELFYIDVNKMLLNIETTTKFLRTTHNVYISPASGKTYLSDDFGNVDQIKLAINQVENVKNNIINSLTGTDYDKIMKIHDYLVDNIDYDSTYQATGTYNIYGALIGKKCVCEGYAKSLKYLANQAGIKCEIMQGTGTNSSGQTESHAWNCAKIDGIWYEIDATWDDPIIIGNGYKANVYKYRYFLKGTVSFEKDHILSHQFSEGGKSFEYPIISKRDY